MQKTINNAHHVTYTWVGSSRAFCVHGLVSGVARECFTVGHVIAGSYAVQGGSGGMLLNFRPSKGIKLTFL